jgi:hypothetical protein
MRLSSLHAKHESKGRGWCRIMALRSLKTLDDSPLRLTWQGVQPKIPALVLGFKSRGETTGEETRNGGLAVRAIGSCG